MGLPVLLTSLSAVLYALSFPPISFFPLMWVALVPFFLVAARVRPSQAAACGMLWGAVMTWSFGWSFPDLVANYFGLSEVVGWVGLLAVSMGLFGIYFGAFAAWLSWLVHRRAVNPWLIAAGWGVCEFARANLFIGNPLALSCYSQVALTRLMQITDVTGPYGVGLLIAGVNACLAGFFAPGLRGYRPVLSSVGVGLALGLTLVYGGWRLSQTFTAGEPVRVAIVQGAVERQFRWNPHYRDANLAHYLRLTQEAAETQPDLIFWPENAVDFPLQLESSHRQALFQVTRNLGAELILGGPYYRFGVTEIHNRNSVFLVRRERVAGRYDKLRLLPIAEEAWLGWLFSRKTLPYEPGSYLHTLQTQVARIGVFVCFEALYPDLVRRFVLRGAEVLANPSNDDWFGYVAPARHLLDIATTRAIENRRYLVRPTTTGFSAVIDPYGRLVTLSRFGQPEILTATIQPAQVQTPYQRWGDAAAWIMVAYAVIGSLVWRNGRG